MRGGLLIEIMASQSVSPAGSFVFESVVHGHHIYKRVWTPLLGERLQIDEEDNIHDARAVAVRKVAM